MLGAGLFLWGTPVDLPAQQGGRGPGEQGGRAINTDPLPTQTVPDVGTPAGARTGVDVGRRLADPDYPRFDAIDPEENPRLRDSIRVPRGGVEEERPVPPDRWRYVQHEGRWWYYTPDERWMYWDNGRWVTLRPRPPIVAPESIRYGMRGLETAPGPVLQLDPRVTARPPHNVRVDRMKIGGQQDGRVRVGGEPYGPGSISGPDGLGGQGVGGGFGGGP